MSYATRYHTFRRQLGGSPKRHYHRAKLGELVKPVATDEELDTLIRCYKDDLEAPSRLCYVWLIDRVDHKPGWWTTTPTYEMEVEDAFWMAVRTRTQYERWATTHLRHRQGQSLVGGWVQQQAGSSLSHLRLLTDALPEPDRDDWVVQKVRELIAAGSDSG